MPVASRLALLIGLLVAAPAAHAAVVPAAHRASARSAVAVRAVAFETAGAALTVRVRTSAQVASFSVQRDGRTVRLTIVGADLAQDVERGRAAPPVRDYRIDGERDGVTVTFDAPGGSVPRASRDARSTDLLLTFAPDETAARREPRPTSRRGSGWGRSSADPQRGEPARTELPRAEPVRVDTRPADVRPVAAAPRTPTRRTRRPPGTPTPAVPDQTPSSGAPPASSWQTAPPVVVPYTPEASAVYVANGSNWRLDAIVLDAGHGGHEPGGVGLYGVTDSKVALAVVMRLGPRIERELGIRVVYTRNSDRFVELDARGPMANRAGAKLFVSVHGNVGAPSASGTETFFLAPRGSASAREVMMRENEIVRRETDPGLYTSTTTESDIIAALAMSAYQEESQFLARLVEREFVNQGRRSRGVKQDNFQVLREASMPAILVETGFVSNPEEARYLMSERGLDEVSDALFRAIRAYRDHYESGLRLAATG